MYLALALFLFWPVAYLAWRYHSLALEWFKVAMLAKHHRLLKATEPYLIGLHGYRAFKMVKREGLPSYGCLSYGKVRVVSDDLKHPGVYTFWATKEGQPTLILSPRGSRALKIPGEESRVLKVNHYRVSDAAAVAVMVSRWLDRIALLGAARGRGRGRFLFLSRDENYYRKVLNSVCVGQNSGIAPEAETRT